MAVGAGDLLFADLDVAVGGATAHLGTVRRIPSDVFPVFHAGVCKDHAGYEDALSAESGTNNFSHYASPPLSTNSPSG